MFENSFDSTWKSLGETFSSNDKVPFMKLQPGKNIIRIGSNPSRINQHWEKDRSGNSRKIVCIGADCPICAAGKKPNIRYQMKILDKNDSDNIRAKVLEVGTTLIRQFSEYANDPDYGDPSEYDLKVNKDGSGRETRYTVSVARSKIPMSNYERELINAIPDIRSINKELTREEILNMDLQCFNNNVDDEFAFSNTKSSNSQQFNNSKPQSQAARDWEGI